MSRGRKGEKVGDISMLWQSRCSMSKKKGWSMLALLRDAHTVEMGYGIGREGREVERCNTF